MGDALPMLDLPVLPPAGERVADLLSRCMAASGRSQREIAAACTDLLQVEHPDQKVTQSFLAQLAAGRSAPARTLRGRLLADRDPRYAALAQVLGLDMEAFVARVVAEQVSSEQGDDAEADRSEEAASLADISPSADRWIRLRRAAERMNPDQDVFDVVLAAISIARTCADDPARLRRLEELGHDAYDSFIRSIPPAPSAAARTTFDLFIGKANRTAPRDDAAAVLRALARAAVEADGDETAIATSRSLTALARIAALWQLRDKASVLPALGRIPGRLAATSPTRHFAPPETLAEEMAPYKSMTREERLEEAAAATRVCFELVRRAGAEDRLAPTPYPREVITLYRRAVRRYRS